MVSPIWSIEFLKEAEKDLRKLDRPVQVRIVKFLRERVALLENPRTVGASLSGSTLGDFWKYRIGDYRIIVDIQDRKLTVLVIAVGNRREIYR